MNLIYKCCICQKECKNITSLTSHIQFNHKDYDTKKYYDEFYKTPDEGICEVCSKETKYNGILGGYAKFCSRSCSHNTEQFRERFRKAVNDKTEQEMKEWQKKIQESVKAKSTNGKCISDAELKNRENKCLLRYKEIYTYITEYHNTVAKGICPECNEEFEIDRWTLHNRQRLNLPICTNCYPINYTKLTGQSFFENDIYIFIKNNYKNKIVRNNRNVLENMEIDIWLPDINIGIECDGTYWHADPRFFDENYVIKQNGKIAKDVWENDCKKDQIAKEKGITLIRIKEYDWKNNKEQEKQRLLVYLQNEGLL